MVIFLEDYVKRIYEVPDSWTDNNLAVLKAQAIAARSWCLHIRIMDRAPFVQLSSVRYLNQTQKGNWERGECNRRTGYGTFWTTNKAWFSSTHGGYVFYRDIGGQEPRDQKRQRHTGMFLVFQTL